MSYTPTAPLTAHEKSAIAQELWQHYWDSQKSVDARNSLMEHYLPLVRFAATLLRSRSGNSSAGFDIDELVQFGVFGLKDAIRGFDPARGFKFETYCMHRVRGAMLDGLKGHQWAPRDIRRRVASFVAVREQGICEEGARPCNDVIASRLGVCHEAVEELHTHASRMQMIHLSDSSNRMEEADAVIPDHREEDPALTTQRNDVRELFLRGLSETERHVLILYYYENLSMREIGVTLGISCTRVSQMHSAIVATLRERLQARVVDGRGKVLANEQI